MQPLGVAYMVTITVTLENGEQIYTKTDGNGNYPLDSRGNIWFSHTLENPLLDDLDGEPEYPLMKF